MALIYYDAGESIIFEAVISYERPDLVTSEDVRIKITDCDGTVLIENGQLEAHPVEENTWQYIWNTESDYNGSYEAVLSSSVNGGSYKAIEKTRIEIE
jgi:hypothetical protein